MGVINLYFAFAACGLAVFIGCLFAGLTTWAIEELYERKLAGREEAVREAEAALHRKAKELEVALRGSAQAIEDDTVISLLDWRVEAS